jgi:pentatricopeptide repeat protein
MGEEGFSPDVTTLACIVKACGSTGHIEKGKEIHDEMNRKGWLGKHIMLGNALIDMYAKCSALANAKDVIDALPSRDTVSWSTLISAYAQQGQGEEALSCFERMKCDGIAPNAITFLSVLNACSHSGFVDRGQMHFEDMKERYGITPDLDHLACMVDLFGRAGHFDKAMAMLKRMPLSNYAPAWRSLLGACRKWANVKLGRLAFDEVVQLDSNNPAIYIAMANIYTAAGMKADAEKIEAMKIDSMQYFRER